MIFIFYPLSLFKCFPQFFRSYYFKSPFITMPPPAFSPKGNTLNHNFSSIYSLALFIIVITSLNTPCNPNERSLFTIFSYILSRFAPNDTINKIDSVVHLNYFEILYSPQHIFVHKRRLVLCSIILAPLSIYRLIQLDSS